MFDAQAGGSQVAEPVVANGGNWDGAFVLVKSQDIEHGGVNIVVRAARGAVMEADMASNYSLSAKSRRLDEAAKVVPHEQVAWFDG